MKDSGRARSHDVPIRLNSAPVHSAQRHDFINTLLGVELPIIQAPMAGVQDEALTVAVSEAADSARCHAHC
jgi:hypothetical protein